MQKALIRLTHAVVPGTRRKLTALDGRFQLLAEETDMTNANTPQVKRERHEAEPPSQNATRSIPDPTETEHPTGDKRAAENIDSEPAG